MAHDQRIKPDRMIELLLSILDREIRLTGTEAPKKTVSQNTNLTIDATSRFHRFVQSAAGLSDAQLEQVFQFAANIEREALPAPAGPPLLELREGG
jgi:hypothetical protein